MVPVYMSQLGLIQPLSEGIVTLLKNTSFVIIVLALFTGAFIVIKSMWSGLWQSGKCLKKF
jgi:hypothetical protein